MSVSRFVAACFLESPEAESLERNISALAAGDLGEMVGIEAFGMASSRRSSRAPRATLCFGRLVGEALVADFGAFSR